MKVNNKELRRGCVSLGANCHLVRRSRYFFFLVAFFLAAGFFAAFFLAAMVFTSFAFDDHHFNGLGVANFFQRRHR